MYYRNALQINLTEQHCIMEESKIMLKLGNKLTLLIQLIYYRSNLHNQSYVSIYLSYIP